MKLLITGGLGLVGTQIINTLRARNFQKNNTLVVVDNLLYETDYLDRDVVFKNGCAGDKIFMENLFSRYRFDAVIHLAGIVGDAACGYRPDEAKRGNIDSLQILRDSFEGRIIFPSSCSVYGANDDLVTETSPVNPLSLYAEMKVQGEAILEGKPNTVILRLGTLHGVSGRLRSDLVVHILTIRALLENRMTVFGGQQFRPLLHVEDLANTIIDDLLTSDITGVYNLVEDNYTIRQIAEIIQSCGLQNANIEAVEMPFEDRRNYKASAEKAKATWGFDPQFRVHHTVEDIKKLYSEGRIKDFSHIKYSNISALKFGDKNGNK